LHSNQLLFSENIKVEEEYFEKLNMPFYEDPEKLKNANEALKSKEEQNISEPNKKQESIININKINCLNLNEKCTDISSIKYYSHQDNKYANNYNNNNINLKTKEKKVIEAKFNSKLPSTDDNNNKFSNKAVFCSKAASSKQIINSNNNYKSNIFMSNKQFVPNNDDIKKSISKILSKSSSSNEANKMIHINLQSGVNNFHAKQDKKSPKINAAIDNNKKLKSINENSVETFTNYKKTEKHINNLNKRNSVKNLKTAQHRYINNQTQNAKDKIIDKTKNKNLSRNNMCNLNQLKSNYYNLNIEIKNQRTRKRNIIKINLPELCEKSNIANKSRSLSSPPLNPKSKSESIKHEIENSNSARMLLSPKNLYEKHKYAKPRKTSDFVITSQVLNPNKKAEYEQAEENNYSNPINFQKEQKDFIKETKRKLKYLALMEKNGPYIFEHFDDLIETSLIYNSEITMDETNRIFQSETHTKNELLLDKQNFKYVQVILLKKENKFLGSLVKSMENFFDYYIKRRDERGNFMMKGSLNHNGFVNLENYFNANYKSLNNIEVVQISVYLFKYDVYYDYNQYYDRTNIAKDELNLLIRNYQMLKALRENAKKETH